MKIKGIISQHEKFYIRDNISQQWVTAHGRVLTQFSSQRIAKRYADRHLNRFTIFSYDAKTKTIKWKGGERVI